MTERKQYDGDLIRRQEAIFALIDWLTDYLPSQQGKTRKTLYERIKELPSAQQWIPCSEKMPKPNRHTESNVDVYYLAQTEFGDMIVASYNESHEGKTWWEQMYSYRIFDDEIVAWMPLPEPYKGEQHE